MATQEWAPIIAALTAGENLDYGQSYWLVGPGQSGGPAAGGRYGEPPASWTLLTNRRRPRYVASA